MPSARCDGRVRRQRDEGDREDGERDPDHGEGAGSLAASQRVDGGHECAHDRSHRRDEADHSARHRGVEQDEPEADRDPARQRPCDIGRRHPLPVDERRSRHGEHEPGDLRGRNHANGAGAAGDDPADEVRAADEQSGRDREKGRHVVVWSARVNGDDPDTAASRSVHRAVRSGS